MLLEDKETYQASKKVLDTPEINFLGLVDLLNDHIHGMFTEDQTIRVKDLMLLNEQKFVLDSVPLQILMLEGKVEHTFKVIKDAISMVKIYFKKPELGPQTEQKIIYKTSDTQTCDDLHFEQIKLEIRKQRRYFQNKKATSFNQMMTSLEESNELVAFIEAITTPPKPPTPPPQPEPVEEKPIVLEVPKQRKKSNFDSQGGDDHLSAIDSEKDLNKKS
jgi:hypothetical protein